MSQETTCLSINQEKPCSNMAVKRNNYLYRDFALKLFIINALLAELLTYYLTFRHFCNK
jgi:hypothetical protein